MQMQMVTLVEMIKVLQVTIIWTTMTTIRWIPIEEAHLILYV